MIELAKQKEANIQFRNDMIKSHNKTHHMLNLTKVNSEVSKGLMNSDYTKNIQKDKARMKRQLTKIK